MLRSEPLDEEYHSDYRNHHGHYGQVGAYFLQSLDSSSHRDGGRYHAVGKQGARPDNGYHVNPPAPVSPEQGVEGQYAALAVVVGTQRDKHVFYRSLQRKRPYYTRKRAEDIVSVERLAGAYDGFHHVKGRRSYVAEHYPECHQQPSQPGLTGRRGCGSMS